MGNDWRSAWWWVLIAILVKNKIIMSNINALIEIQHALLLEVDALNLVDRKTSAIKSKITIVLQGLHQLQPAPIAAAPAPAAAASKKPAAKKKTTTKNK